MHPEHPVEESTSVLWRAFGRLTHGGVGVSFLLVLGLPASTALARGVDEVVRQAAAVEDGAPFSPADDQGRFVHLIELAEPGVLHRVERAPRERFDARSPEARAQLEQVMAEQAAHVQRMAAALGRDLDVTHYYTMTHSGLATRLTLEEAQALRGLAGVVSVERERLYELTTYRGPTFIGADSIWDGDSTPDGEELRGEGLAIAVLDTGVVDDHPAFANVAACGHGGADPDKLLSFLDCSTTDGSGLCNGPGPRDINGHGTHTASTAGGNVLDDTADPPAEPPAPFTEITGVAPCAHVRTYKVCPTSCPEAQVQAGMTSVLMQQNDDGVPIVTMNFSLSGGTSPWDDNDRRKLDLVEAGIVVAASAGNTSAGVPNPVGNVNHRGPWVMTVAASTRDTDSGGGSAQGDVLAGFSLRGPTPAPLADLQKPDITAPGVGILAGSAVFTFSVSGPGMPPPDLQDIPMIIGNASPIGDPLTDHPILFDPAQPPGADGCNPGFPSDFFDGAVALIQRGTCAFTEKINNAAAAGADMVIIWNNEPGTVSMNTTGQDPNTPAFSITQADGQAVRDFIDTNPGATIDYQGESVAGYGFSSGTSMSSPHVAGAATLVRHAQPDWTPSEVKSALLMTAFTGGFKENGATPWDADDVGSGRADLTKAALAGLVMDETTANYLAANPAMGGDVKTLNLPAVRNVDCSPSCSWTRTVRNTLDTATSWTAAGVNITPGFEITVEPSSFTFGGGLGETQVLTITATPEQDLTASVAFGEVVLSETGGLSPDLHMTVAIRGEPEGEPAPVIDVDPASFSVTLPQGATTDETLSIGNLGDVTLTWDIEFATSASPQPLGVEVLWEQTVNGGSGIISDFGNVQDAGVYSADDFELSLSAEITEIFTPGFYNTGSLATNATAITWAIYPDDGGVPAGHPEDGGGSEVWTFTAAPTAAGVSIADEEITLDLVTATGSALGLAPGRYWLTVFPHLAIGNILDGNTRWNWFQGTPQLEQAHLIDPQNLFGGGFTSWTSFGALGLSFTGTAFTLTGMLQPVECGSTPPSWLTVSPLSGSVDSGSPPDDVTLTFDATGLALGDYETVLCVNSNDPVNSLIVVPLDLTVIEPIPAPELSFDPSGLDFGNVDVGETSPQQSSTLSNTGEADATELTFTESGSLGFDVDATTCGATLPAGGSCPVMVTFTPTEPGPAAATLEASSAEGASASLALSGNGVGEGGFTATALEVDPEVLFSDGNRVFEPGEVVVVAPSWRNDEPTPQDVTGSADDFTGPDGAVYTLVVPDADYGMLDPGETASCLDVGPDTAACYQMGVDNPALRPATHWDATFEETLFDGTGKTWTLHIGDSFGDVARASGFYRFIETLLHHQVTGGCTEAEYCPEAVNTRAQMPVFVLRALEGPDFTPKACVPGEESFNDVPATNGFCPWIEELALRNVVAGCGNDNYCPDDPINRQQMAVFLLRTFGGPTFTPPECSGIFDDVACPSPFADWVEELFNREITGGCSVDPPLYCPVDSVNRQQMAVFVIQTFGLQLYGP